MMLRTRMRNCSWALCLAAALSMISLATPALAGHSQESDRDRGRSEYRGGDRGRGHSADWSRGRGHASRWSFGRGHHRRYHARRHPVPAHRVVVHEQYCARDAGTRHGSYRSHEAYYCKPCGHRFDDRQTFHRHLQHHHHVPLWRIPAVVIGSTLGWVFYG